MLWEEYWMSYWITEWFDSIHVYVYISLICSTWNTDFGVKVKDEIWKCIYKMWKQKYRNNVLFFFSCYFQTPPIFELYSLYRNDQHRTPKLEENFLNSYPVNFSSLYGRSQNFGWLFQIVFHIMIPSGYWEFGEAPNIHFGETAFPSGLFFPLEWICPHWSTTAEVQDISLPAGMWWVRTANYLMLLTNVGDFAIPASFFIPFIFLYTIFYLFFGSWFIFSSD